MLHSRIAIAALLALPLASTGCQSPTLPSVTSAYDQGSILILPVRDATGDAGADSGALVGQILVAEFSGRRWDATVLLANDSIGHAAPVTAEQAVAAGREKSTRFALTVTLGEAHDAKAFSGPTPDSVMLEDARLYDCETGDAVWSLAEPYEVIDSAWSDVSPCYYGIATLIAASISSGSGGS